jgi:hypothetical protein
MFKKLFFLLPVTLGSSLLLTGAWRGPLPPPTPPPAPRFLAQNVPVNPDLIGEEATGMQLLDQAIAHLSPGRVTWLHTQVWQKMSDAQIDFEAEGTLDLAPGQSARLDLTVRTQGVTGRLLTVSDGHALAQVRQMGGASPQVDSVLLPIVTPWLDGNSPQRLKFLDDKGCGGPAAILAGLRRHVAQFRLQTGKLQGKDAIQFQGELTGEVKSTALQTNTPPRSVVLFLDAQTLWPHRVEWWGQDPRLGMRAIVEIEFRQPVLNREVPLQQCAQLFSYHPADTE